MIDGESGARRALRLLVVDDDRDAADRTAQLLCLLGHRVAVAYDGPTALAQAVSARPDVVLVEVALRGMDGHEVCRQLAREGLGRVPVLALTTRDDPPARSNCFTAYLRKPLEMSMLRSLFGRGVGP